MSRGMGKVQRAIVSEVSDRWLTVEQLARRAYSLDADTPITASQRESVRRAVHKLPRERALVFAESNELQIWVLPEWPSRFGIAAKPAVREAYNLGIERINESIRLAQKSCWFDWRDRDLWQTHPFYTDEDAAQNPFI